MPEYREIVDEITRELGVRHRKLWQGAECLVQFDKLSRAIKDAMGGRTVLCFPGGAVWGLNESQQVIEHDNDAFYPEAFFFALGNKLYRTNGTYHSLKGALTQMVSFLKTYGEEVEATILVTDMWDPNHFVEIEPELRPFADKVGVSTYLCKRPLSS